MYKSEKLELWNITPGVPALANAQKIFNIVGRLKSPNETKQFLYTLNGGPEKHVFFNRGPGRTGRLQYPGDFNIDTINEKDLQPINKVVFKFVDGKQTVSLDEVCFAVDRHTGAEPRFALNLEKVDHAHQVGQVVDGNWKVTCDPSGKPCLEIPREESGLDRIILFGRHDWTTGYTVSAKLAVTAWTRTPYNVGLVFKWNEHLQGDGTYLPKQWSTGLGYFSSYDLGLRIRFGVDVHIDDLGNKVGDYVLRDGHLSALRYWGKRFLESRWTRPIPRRLLPFDFPFTEIASERTYTFKMHVHPTRYALTVWQSSKKEPRPLLEVAHPLEHLPRGSVGIIAYNCAVRVYSFNVDPDP